MQFMSFFYATFDIIRSERSIKVAFIELLNSDVITVKVKI